MEDEEVGFKSTPSVAEGAGEAQSNPEGKEEEGEGERRESMRWKK